eukprot:2079619-Prorocentrum_lima.AAC.1
MMTNMYLKKPTEIWASDERLIRYIRTLRCNGRHQHMPKEGGRAHPARIWIWEFASRIASGVAAVVRDHHSKRCTCPDDYPPPHQRDRQ